MIYASSPALGKSRWSERGKNSRTLFIIIVLDKELFKLSAYKGQKLPIKKNLPRLSAMTPIFLAAYRPVPTPAVCIRTKHRHGVWSYLTRVVRSHNPVWIEKWVFRMLFGTNRSTVLSGYGYCGGACQVTPL